MNSFRLAKVNKTCKCAQLWLKSIQNFCVCLTNKNGRTVGEWINLTIDISLLNYGAAPVGSKSGDDWYFVSRERLWIRADGVGNNWYLPL